MEGPETTEGGPQTAEDAPQDGPFRGLQSSPKHNPSGQEAPNNGTKKTQDGPTGAQNNIKTG
eukprot:6223347-Pyramimonas_sp.AAC.1